MIYVDTSSREMTFFCRASRSKTVMRKRYPVAIGAPSTPTPLGKFHIIRKVIFPERYYAFGWNPVARFAKEYGVACLELNVGNYAIHGCSPDVPLVDQYSHGCIRMLEPDLVEIFNWVHKGQAVVIWNGRYKESQQRDIPDYNRIRVWPPLEQ